ncbi:Urea transporter 1 [Acipenser ruthenus]|uniref:Urea transporter 1 n=1 Tax=Acipenser ruthenus TaxID=7906 RepID=A0A444U3B0_ACIRT|nr:Urea transporter 1 [Acipenser ruthenus]
MLLLKCYAAPWFLLSFRVFVLSEKPFLLQLLEWSLRGLSQVIMVDNPLSGVLILVALILYNPWYTLTTTVGLLSSTLTALIIGQDSADVSKGVYGFNGALVALLIAVFSAMGDCTLLFSGLATLLKGWDIPVMVFPFNSALSLYMSATGPHNLYFPQQHVQPDIVLAHSNVTDLDLLRLLEGVPLGVGQIFACDDLWACGLILLAVFVFSPLLCVHALLGSCVGIITGLSLAVPHSRLYSGLAGFNGALGCMAIGGFFFAFNWKTHLFAITSESPLVVRCSGWYRSLPVRTPGLWVVDGLTRSYDFDELEPGLLLLGSACLDSLSRLVTNQAGFFPAIRSHLWALVAPVFPYC